MKLKNHIQHLIQNIHIKKLKNHIQHFKISTIIMKLKSHIQHLIQNIAGNFHIAKLDM